MPAIVLSPIKITNVSGDATILFGDTLQITPKSVLKSYNGANSGHIGDFSINNNLISFTNTSDPDIADSTIAGNN
ncbi:spore germination protein [Paenibacillus filicis]|uniref:Spore germination protein n=1 Tax=Paenibacillus gyeongsangnamensis TaxID=3388067 RepID=A0ABT4Q917_9BACL|nr:spore germination protein [Paenibacillus filicis]MCZ8513371.1 spore germination protein [Paenibacillus filicis]